VSTNWLSDVAQKLGMDIADVAETVARHQIKPSPVVPRPKRIALKRIYFSGIKAREENAEVFVFDWDELGPGLWGILSERNQRGKSSIFGVVLWLMRGRSPSFLQEDVFQWIQNAALRFTVGDVTYQVSVVNTAEVEGDLSRIDEHGVVHELFQFSNNLEFESVMSSFMMGQLSLDPVVVWNGDAPADGGKRVTHEWPFLSGAMFIGTDYTSLLGDVTYYGLPVRLMQMFVGLPWVSTLTEAKASESSLNKEKHAAERRIAEEKQRCDSRLEEIKSKIHDISVDLNKIPTSQHVYDAHRKVSGRLRAVFDSIREAERQLEDARMLEEDAERAFLSDKKELQQFVDAHAAGAVFRRLAPTICPRCEAAIPASRLQEEQKSGECCVCNGYIIEDEGADEKRAELSEQVIASETALSQGRQQLEKARKALTALEEESDSLQNERERLESELDSYSDRKELENSLKKAEGQLDEVQRNFVDLVPEDVSDAKVITQVVKIIDGLVKSNQKVILEEVSAKILEYAKRFGLENYTQAQLNGAGQLKIIKGGESTSYSKVTQGEQLRLKVATMLAIISVSHTSGVGRHPGLLMIDSPGSQEMVGTDLGELMSGMAEVISELPFLQVFVASVASDLMASHIDEKMCVSASGDNYLW
jgi:predicted nuclease with TOPRIM domain